LAKTHASADIADSKAPSNILSLPNGATWFNGGDKTATVYVRPCMQLLFESTVGSGKAAIAIGGTTGVGKSICMGYFVYRALLMHLQQTSGSAPHPAGRMPASGDLVFRLIEDTRVQHSAFDVLLKFNLISFTVQVVDNRLRELPGDYCFIDGYQRRIQYSKSAMFGKVLAVFASQTSEGHFHGKDGGDYPTGMYIKLKLPTWSLADTTSALQREFNLSAIEQAFAIFGGSLRHVLRGLRSKWNFKDSSAIDALRGPSDLVSETIVFACDAVQLYLPRDLIELFDVAIRKSEKVETMNDPLYASLLSHQFVTSPDLLWSKPVFASAFVRVLLTKWCWSSGVEKIDRFVTNFGGSAFGRVFELFAHCSILSLPPGPLWVRTAKRGGGLHNTKTKLSFPPPFHPGHRPVVLFFEDLASLQPTVARLVATKGWAYLLPVNPNNTLFDAVLIDARDGSPIAYLLQHTVAGEHDLVDIWSTVRDAFRPCKLQLIFIIPFDKEWKQPPRMLSRIPADVQQYHLPYIVHQNLVAVPSD